jgi:hypothetical protein
MIIQNEQIGRFAVILSNRQLPRANAGTEMCEKCIEIDAKIEHYQRLSSMVTDPRALDAIKKLVEQMKAKKVTLHPEQQQ